MALFEPGTYDASALTPATRALAAGTPADPPPAHRVNSFALQVALQSDPPGWWAGNVWEQYANYQGAVAIAIEAYMTALKGAKYTVLRRKTKVQKSLGGGQGIHSRDDDYEPVEPDHPLAQVLAEPSGEDGVWTMADEAAFIALQYQLTGTSFVWMPRNRDGKPVRLFGLTTGSITQTIAPGNPMYPQGAYMVTPYVGNAGWMAGGGMVAQTTPLPAEEVQRFRRLNPVSRTFGLSRLDTGARDIDMLKAITEFRWSYFNSGVALDTVVMLPGADQETQERTERQLLQKSGGAKNARKLLVVGGNVGEGNGKASIQQLAPNAKDLDFPQGFEQALGQVLAIFGVPKLVANFGDSSNYATFHGELRRFYDNTISPFCRDLSAFLTRALARPWSEYAGEYVIEIEPQIPKDVDAERTELQSALSAGAITVNEYRMATGRDAWDDGDEPLAIVMQKKQAAAQPAPMPGMDGGAMPPEDGAGATAPEGDGDDSPEGVQDATLQAALSALGMGGDQAAPMPVQKGFDPNEKRDETGKWTAGGGALDAASVSHEEWQASAISPGDAAPILSKIRAGDERSKNKGDKRPEPVLKPVVLASVPIASLPERVVQQLRETTSAERVERYASQKIDTPAILTALRSGEGFGVSDGGHRIMAAIARGDTHVPAFVPVGSYELLKKFSGEPVQKAWSESSHPRDDSGRFVSAGEINQAAADPKRAATLRASVTNPEQRKKLDALLGSHKPFAAQPGRNASDDLHFKDAASLTGRLYRHLSGVIKRFAGSDPEEIAEEFARQKKLARKFAAHWNDAKSKAAEQFWADYKDRPTAEVAKQVVAVSEAFDSAREEMEEWYQGLAEVAEDIANSAADDPDVLRRGTHEHRTAFAEHHDSANAAAQRLQDAVWDAIEKARDALGGKEKGYKLGRYFKAAAPVSKPGGRVRQEGERWTGRDGRQWTKKNGKIVPAPQQAGTGSGQGAAPAPTGSSAAPAQQQPQQAGSAAGGVKPDAHPGGRVNIGALLKDPKFQGPNGLGDTDKLAQAVTGRIAGHLAAGGKVTAHYGTKQVPIVAIKDGMMEDEKGQRWGMLALASEGDKGGLEFHPVAGGAQQPGSGAAPAPTPAQPATDPKQAQKYHAEIIKRAGKNAKAFGLTPEVLAKMHPDAVKVIAAQLGVAQPEEAYAQHAAAVPVTPAAKTHLQRAQEWADGMAAKHAQRVAQHLGIRPEAAQKILAKAIRQVAEHALKNGGRASGTLNVGGQSLRLGVGKPGDAAVRNSQRAESAPASPARSKPPTPQSLGLGARPEAKDRPGTAAGSPTPEAPPQAAPRRGLLSRLKDSRLGRLGGRALEAYKDAVDRGIILAGNDEERADARERRAGRVRKAFDVWQVIEELHDAGESEIADELHDLMTTEDEVVIRKSMNTLSDADGGFLVPPATPRRRKRAKVPVAALVRKALYGGLR
jgi:phage portal protein BeeE